MMADSGKGIMPQSQVVDVSRSEYQQITVLENMTLVQTWFGDIYGPKRFQID